MKYSLITLLLLSAPATGQTVYDVPFASSGNVVELTVENTSQIPQSAVSVKADQAPSWIRFDNREQVLESLAGGDQTTVRFAFSVDKSAPVNSQQTVSFTVTGSSGQQWSKIISLKVSPPQSFELFQNYPNPFNPTTTIGYLLPQEGRVTLRIYNLIGQQIVLLEDADRSAGYHQELWDASRHASGTYLYELTARLADGTERGGRKRMMLLK